MGKTQKIGNATIINIDCMEYMKTLPDKFFDLAVVDPPYGLGDRLLNGGHRGGMASLKKLCDSKVKKWDIPPRKEYFLEISRICKKYIIWGGNYFLDHLNATDGFLIWDKMNGTNPMSDAELAWKSFSGTTRIFRMHHFSHGYDCKIHPTQKPVKLYEWILTNYAKPGQTIFDSHMGSGSSAIACNNLGFEYIGCELDEDYYSAACERIAKHAQQERLFY